MTSLVTQVLNRTADRSIVRYGKVEAISGGLASVRMGSAVVENATWLRDYLPVVGDRVAVLASGSGWLILDAVERVQRVYSEPETTLVMPNRAGRVTNILWSSSYDDRFFTPEVDPKLPEPLSGGWQNLSTFDTGTGHYFMQSGYFYVPSGSGDLVNYVPANGYNADFLWYPSLLDQIPANAVIQSVSLVLRLWVPSPSTDEIYLPTPNMPVKVYAHSQPPEGTTAGGLPPEAYLSSSHGTLYEGEANAGDLLAIPLTDDVVADLANGSLKGLAIWPGETQRRVAFQDDGTYHWVKPYPLSPGWHEKSYTTNDCFGLQVTYVTPYAED